MPFSSRTTRTLTIVGLTGALALSGCTAAVPPAPDAVETSAQPDPVVVLADDTTAPRKVLSDSEAGSALQMSQALYEETPVAVVFARDSATGYAGTDADLGPAASAAAGLQVPLLVINPDGGGLAEVTGELDRLRVETVVGYGSPGADWARLRASRGLLAGPSGPVDFSSVLGLDVTPVPVQEPAVITSVSTLDSSDLRLLEIPPRPGPATGETTDPALGSTSDVERSLADQATAATLPDFRAPVHPSPALVLATASSAPAPLATARAAGANVQVLAAGDPRSTPAAVDAVSALPDSPVFGVGADFGTDADFADHTAVAATGVQLPGGGQTVFPGRRMVALYGHPSGPFLGALGEQGIADTMARVKDLAAQYQPYSDEPVIPALDLIATVASGAAGPDGNYSNETPVADLMPWVDAAEKAGIYVVLDFQSGRTDFLSQVRMYEELLTRPTVGLALDPEWRLTPDQVPLEQIGTVSAEEINATSAWLARLTRTRKLPQKMLMVHQFRVDMISNRGALELSHSELSLTLHADGHGTTAQKLETWNALQDTMPAGVWPSWKNFYDEDKPMLTPEQTYTEVAPKPWLVTYQ